MQGDPYSVLVQALTKEQNAPLLRFGTVESVSPMRIGIGGISIGGDSLYLNAELTGDVQDISLTLPASGISEQSGQLQYHEPLKTGDRVLCYSDDDQVFYLICKVVQA